MKKQIMTLGLAGVMALSLAACGSKATTSDTETAAVDLSAIAGSYVYEESVATMEDFTVTWTLTLDTEGAYDISEDNPYNGVTNYTGSYTAEASDDGYEIYCGALTSSSDRTPEASFFEQDGTSKWLIDSEGTLTPVEAENPAQSQMGGGMEDDNAVVSDVNPGEVVGQTFSYEEYVEAYDFTVNWTLTFDDDTTATLFEPNDMMGDKTYTCTWKFDDGKFVTEITSSDTGDMPLADWFDADNNYQCKWVLYQDGNVMYPLSVAEEMQGAGGASADGEYTTVAYADDSDSQVMDIYTPDNATGNDPAIIVVHGGGFKFGDQEMELIQPVIKAAVADGYVVATVDYRKSGEATYPAAVADVKAAVRYLRANASTYGIDADHIAAWGESAGAYLALMTALTPEVTELNGDVDENLDQSSALTALVDFYGPVEFYTMQSEYQSWGDDTDGNGQFESAFLGVDDIYADKDACDATYWETYKDELPSDFSLSAWIQVGDENDTNVPYTQSVNFADRLQSVNGVTVEFSQIEGAAHEDDAFYTDENLAAVLAFLDGVMK